MALSILDGNQSATTLSTIVTSGQHIPAHTVVSIGTQAITDISGAISGSTVCVGNLGLLQSAVATEGLTASGAFIKIGGHAGTSTTGNIAHVSAIGALRVDGSSFTQPISIASVTIGNTVTIAGTVTANPTGTQTIAGTVTANLASVVTTDTYWATQAVKVTGGNGYGIDIAGIDYAGSPALFSEGGGIPVYPRSDFAEGASFPVSGTVSLGIQQSDDADANIKFIPIGYATVDGGGQLDQWTAVDPLSPLPVYFPSNNPLPAGTNRIGVVTIGGGTVTIGAGTAQIGSVTVGGTVTANIGGIASSVTLPVRLFAEKFGEAPSGQDTLLVCNSSGMLLVDANSGGSSVLGFDGNAFVQVKQVSGSSVTVGNSVTIGSLPAISGTVTANTFALQGTAVTTSNFTSTTPSTVLANFNATREVLTIFNEGAGNLHICAGATCTTIAYQVRLSAGDYYEVPNHQTTITHSAVFATAGTARVTQVS
jgi:hypothetical protein